MTTVREISIQSIGEPYSVKIERGQKGGYGYEIGVKSDGSTQAILEVLEMRKKIEEELYGGGQKDENKQ